MMNLESPSVMGQKPLTDKVSRTEADVCGGGGYFRLEVLIQVYLVIDLQPRTSKAKIKKTRVLKKPNCIDMATGGLFESGKPEGLAPAPERGWMKPKPCCNLWPAHKHKVWMSVDGCQDKLLQGFLWRIQEENTITQPCQVHRVVVLTYGVGMPRLRRNH